MLEPLNIQYFVWDLSKLVFTLQSCCNIWTLGKNRSIIWRCFFDDLYERDCVSIRTQNSAKQNGENLRFWRRAPRTEHPPTAPSQLSERICQIMESAAESAPPQRESKKISTVTSNCWKERWAKWLSCTSFIENYRNISLVLFQLSLRQDP